jgi:hypothetical protein
MFNFVGAAAGVQNSLGEALRRDLLMKESQQRQQQIDQQGESIELNRGIQRQNAESLEFSRRSADEERQSRIAERDAKSAQRTRMGEWAKGVMEQTGGQVTDPNDWQSALSIARARNIMATGEDLPDAVTTSILGSYMKNPNDRVKTPQEVAQELEIHRGKAEITAANRAPRASSGVEGERARTREAMTATSNYLTWLMKDSGGDPKVALARWDANPDVALRKAGGNAAIANRVRSLIEGRFRSGQQQFEDNTYQSLLAELPTRPPEDEDQ